MNSYLDFESEIEKIESQINDCANSDLNSESKKNKLIEKKKLYTKKNIF